MSDLLDSLNTRIWELVSGCKSDKKIYDLYVEAIKRDILDIKLKQSLDDFTSSSTKIKMFNRMMDKMEKDLKRDFESYLPKNTFGTLLTERGFEIIKQDNGSF